MNLFLLHAKPKRAARYHCDSHVVKMILETTQVLTAVWYLCAGGKEARHYTRPDKTAFCQPVDSDCLDKKNKSARSTISDDAAINININPENETDTMMNQQQQHNKTTNNDFGGDDEDYVIIAMWTEDRWKEEYQKNTKHQPYKLTHTEHPLIKWAASSRARYMFTARLGLELCKEYTFRYQRVHTCQGMLEWFFDNPVCTFREDLLRGAIASYPHRFAYAGWKHDLLPFPLSIGEAESSGDASIKRPLPEWADPNDPVETYRSYYRLKKTHLLRYKRRGQPTWLKKENTPLA